MSYSRSSVDEQVVKMSFDNSNFDSNVNQSINTLNSLDNKLSSLNKDNFSGLTQNWGNVADFFTVKGQVMFGILTRIGSEVVNLGLKFKNYLFKGIKDGIGEYETIINSTQTIYQNVKQSGASIGDVNAALDELNDYADKTIYNFGQMTNMIGRFASAGVGLNKSVSTIKGLANAAALVGANTEKAQMAWNAVAKAMSKGKFDLLTWKTLEYSGIAGEQFNELIKEVARVNNVTGKSGQNIDEMIAKYGSLSYTLQEGWLDKDLFNEAMQIMSGALTKEDLLVKGYSESQIEKLLAIADAAEEAATKVKTFRQLMDTLGEAVGSGWAQSFRILVGDLEQARDLYTRISDVISNFIDNNAKIRNNLFKQIMDDDNKKRWESNFTSGRESFRKIIENMMAIVKTFLKSVKTGFLNIFPIERIRDAARKVLDIIQKFTRALVINNEEIKETTDGDKVLGWDTKNIKAISEAIKDLIRFFRGLASAIDIVWQVVSQPIKAIFERIPFFQNFFDKTNSGITKLLKNLGNFGDKITVVRNAIKDTNFFGNVVGYLIDNIEELGKKYPVLGAILWVFKSMKLVFEGIKDTFKRFNIKPLATIFGVIKFIAESVWKILNFVFGIIKNIKDSINWSFLDGPKNAIIAFLKKLSDYGQGLISFEELTGNIGAKLKEIFSKIFSLFDKSNKASNKTIGFIDKVQKAAGKIGSVLSNIWNKIKSFFEGIGSFFKKIFSGADLSLDGIAKKIALIGGGVAAAALAISHLKKTLGKIKLIDNINNLLMAGVNVLNAYKKQVESKAILNIAIAVGILSGAMLVLSLVPYDKLENGLIIFTSFMATLALTLPPIIKALAKFNDSLGYARQSVTQWTVMNTLAKKFGSAAKKLARGLEFKMIGSIFKDLAIAILILVGAMTALVFLYKYEEKNLRKAAQLVATLIGAMTIAVGGLVLVIELLSKKSKDLSTTVGTFASFFKLAGVARVILAIAAAVLMLSLSMKVMADIKPSRLAASFEYVMWLVGLLGIIAVGVAYFTSKAKDLGKLKKISVSLFGAMAGVALVLFAMKPLIEVLKEDGTAWQKALISFTVVIMLFTSMVGILLMAAKEVGDSPTVWNKMNATIALMAVSLAGIAGVLYVISLMGDIPTNTVITLGIVAASILAVISLFAVIAKADFSGNFVNIIEKISIAIAAVVASIGILAAGIAALVAALGALNVPDSSIKKTQTKLINKLEMIADTISSALPKLKTAMYNIGVSVGSMFLSFVQGFTDSIVSNGEQLNTIADQFVNLIIDLISKIVDILYTRKDDIAQIIKKLLGFVFAEITAVLNSFFKNKNGEGLFTEDGVAKLLGLGGLAYGGFKVLNKASEGFNKIKKSIDEIGVSFKTVKSGGEKVINLFKKINAAKGGTLKEIFSTFGAKDGLTYITSNLTHALGNTKLFKGLGTAVEKVSGGKLQYDNTSDVGFGEAIAAIGAVTVAVKAVEVATHGVNQFLGKELPYIRTDVLKGNEFDTWMTSLGTLFNDKMFLMQVAVEGTSRLGELLITIILTIWHVLVGIVKVIATGIEQIAAWIWEILSAIMALVTWLTGAKGVSQSIIENAADVQVKVNLDWDDTWSEFEQIGKDWKQFAWTPSYEEWTGPDAQDKKQGYKNGYEEAEYVAEGAMDGIYANSVYVNKAYSKTIEDQIETIKSKWDSHSPSNVTKKIYRDVMLGEIEGIKSGEQDYYSYAKHVNDVQIKLAEDSAEAISEAWSNISVDPDFSIDKYADVFSEMNSEEMAAAFKGIGNDIKTWSDLVNSLDFSSYSGALKELTGAEAEAAWYNVAKALDYSEYVAVLNELNAEQLHSAWNGIREAWGYETDAPLRNLTYDLGQGEIIDLNEELVNSIIEVKDEFDGLSWDEAKEKIQGIASGIDEIANNSVVVDEMLRILFSYVEDGAALSADAIEQFNSDTMGSLTEMVGKEKSAQALAFEEIESGYAQMGEVAEELKNDLIGKKKEEVQAILEEEAKERGMSAKLAADTSRLITDDLFNGLNDRESLSEQAYSNNIKIYSQQYDKYRQMEVDMTSATKKFASLRTKLQATAFYDVSKMMQSGEWSVDKYQDYMKNGGLEAQAEYNAVLKEFLAAQSSMKKEYDDVLNEVKDLVLTREPMTDFDNFFDSYYQTSLAVVEKQEQNKRKRLKDYLADYSNALNVKAPELNLGYWDMDELKDSSTLTDSDISSAVNAASDLKDGLESQRADLTPTFDLDQLASDAQKANGIVMSSLMAAQNASIGDYINQDSELNPFMKDRWQNVYNFTQNNYSPKALSRIDIYRQTQRQLSMSRGF